MNRRRKIDRGDKKLDEIIDKMMQDENWRPSSHDDEPRVRFPTQPTKPMEKPRRPFEIVDKDMNLSDRDLPPCPYCGQARKRKVGN